MKLKQAFNHVLSALIILIFVSWLIATLLLPYIVIWVILRGR